MGPTMIGVPFSTLNHSLSLLLCLFQFLKLRLFNQINRVMAPPPPSSTSDGLDWNLDKLLRLYIHDYMTKRGMHNVAEIFKQEGQIDSKVVVESPEGFLHEWWSLFYDVFKSRMMKDAETIPESSSKGTDDARNDNSFPMIPPTSSSDQRLNPLNPFQAGSSSFNPVTAEPAASLIPPTLFNREHHGNLVGIGEPSLQDLFKPDHLKFLSGTSSKYNFFFNLNVYPCKLLTEKQVRPESVFGIRLGMDVPRDPLELGKRTMQPLDGPHETKTNPALNLVPLTEWPQNVGDRVVQNQVLTSHVEEPNYSHQCQVLKTQNPKAVPAQILESTPKSQTFAILGNSTKCSSQYVKTPTPTPKIETSAKDKQLMDRLIRTAEYQYQQDQQLQMLSQNVEKSGKGKKTVYVGSGQSAQDWVGAAYGKPVHENVESFLSLENEHADHRIAPFSNLIRNSTSYHKNDNRGFSFEQIGCFSKSKSKVLSCHFSSDGKILASVGHEKKVFLWNMDTFGDVTTPEAHSLLITDVRFRPSSTIFATSSFDRSVRLWDAARATRSVFKLDGHAEQVMSLDFHPSKVDLLCSCDSNDVIRLWNVNERACIHITKGGSKQVRFQPQFGKFLATSTGNEMKIIDIDTASILCNLKGHVKDVLSICWDRSGNYIASVSEDSARIWSLDGKCIHELHSTGNKFQSCIFHPAYLNLLVIGGYQTLELWSPIESNKTWAVPHHNGPPHKGLIVGLADTPEGKLIASASHDCCVKLWK
ncbi:hypothetical protein RIF29_41351 [Crotalaria pallida]|uniref:Uncharacterized protein n=1 Tax=Crotalaria pallida TaxID=3830 RepID=A0AAN9HV70_CROPI